MTSRSRLLDLPDELLEQTCWDLDLPDLLNLTETSSKGYHVCKKIYDVRKTEYGIRKREYDEMMNPIYIGPGGGKYRIGKFRERVYLTPQDKELDLPFENRILTFGPPGSGRFWINNQGMRQFFSLEDQFEGATYDPTGPFEIVEAAGIVYLFDPKLNRRYWFDEDGNKNYDNPPDTQVTTPPTFELRKVKRFPLSVIPSFRKRLDVIKAEVKALEDEGLMSSGCRGLINDTEEELLELEGNPTPELEELISDNLDQLENFCSESYLMERERLRQNKGKIKFEEI